MNFVKEPAVFVATLRVTTSETAVIYVLSMALLDSSRRLKIKLGSLVPLT